MLSRRAASTLRRRGNSSGRSSPPVPGQSTLPRHRTALLAGAAVVLAAALIALLVLVPGNDDDTVGPDPDRVAELQAQEAERDAEQVAALGEFTRSMRDSLLPVVEGLGEGLTADGPPSFASADEVASWKSTTRAAVDSLADPPSGGTGHNIALGALRSAVELFDAAVTTYDLARAAEGDERAALADLAADLRGQAIRAWSVAATQLDLISIDAGLGHVHIYLPAEPGSGAMSPDSFPEGSESDDDHDHGAGG